MARGRRRPNGAGRVDRAALWSMPGFQDAAREVLPTVTDPADSDYMRAQLKKHRPAAEANRRSRLESEE